MQTGVRHSRMRTPSQARQWVIRPFDNRCAELARALRVCPLVAQVLINRSVSDPQAASSFLRPKLTDLIAPDRMPGVGDAVRRLKNAVLQREKITIYGDYDVDGITGVAILWRLLRLLGAEVDYYIPHRVDEGYGLNDEAVRSLAESGARLILTVDCGVTALESAALARRLGMDLIITDHHGLAETLPQANAIVHPALEAGYPNPDAAGAVVAFKLAWALANEFAAGPRLDPDLRQFMLNATSLAAMGTVADVVDLRGENRVLTSYGLKSLPQCSLPGIAALIESAGLTGKGLDSFDIGFRLAPMLNAAGRMGHARLAVDLLTSDSPVHCRRIAEYLKEQNAARRQCEKKIFQQAAKMVVERGLNHPDHKGIVLAGENWHSGVIGVVAGRIAEKFYRPTVMICLTDAATAAVGSARSIPGFNLYEAVKACSAHLVRFGGHEMAAGVTIRPADIEAFAGAFDAWARDHLAAEDTVSKLHIDAALPLSEFRHDVVRELQMLGPFGQGNPEPCFATRGVRLAGQPRRCGAQGDHLQLAVTDNTSTIRCIGFRLGNLEKKLLESDFFSVAYQPQINTYNGNSNVQLVLADVQFE